MDRIAPTDNHAYIHNGQKVYEWNQTVRWLLRIGMSACRDYPALPVRKAWRGCRVNN